MKFITRTEANQKVSESRLQNTEAMLCNQQASIQNLENQVGRMATFLAERPQGSLPSNTEANPKGQLKATKRVREEEEEDGEETAMDNPREEVTEEGKKEEVIFDQEKEKEIGTNEKRNGKGEGATIMEEEVKDEDTSEEDDQEMVETPPRNSRMTKPRYVQHIKVFIKEKRRMMKKKRKVNDESSTELAKEDTPPPKQEDSGSFAIPCKIGNIVTRALADLGSGVNLLPYSMFEKANIGELQPANMSIELADATVKPVKGIIRDVPIHTHNFTIRAGFIVMDMEITDSFPVILGRPSLATCKAIIDVKGGIITLGAGKEDITFYASNHPLYPSHSHMKKKSMGREEEKAEAHHEEDNLVDTLHDQEEEEEPMEECIMEEDIETNENQGDQVLHEDKKEKEYHAPRIKLGDDVLYYKVKVNPQWGRVKKRWIGTYIVTGIFPEGITEIFNSKKGKQYVGSHLLKTHHGGG